MFVGAIQAGCRLSQQLVTVTASTHQGSSRPCAVLPANLSATTAVGISVSPPLTARLIIAVASAVRSCLWTERSASVVMLVSWRSARSRLRRSGVAARSPRDAAAVVSMLPPASTAVRILLRASADETWRRVSRT